ncbi:uncharacterized protein BDR25DRAFT_243382, partial [Lindgomyces ingoldianus]
VGLQVPRRKKYALLAICSVGCFTLITSIIRLPFLHDLNKSTDPTWGVTDVATWSIAELGSAITTASIPTTRPLISWIFPKFRLTSSGPSQDETRPPNSYALSSVVSGTKRRDINTYTEIHAGKDGQADNESEDYILNENGRVIRQTVKMSVSTESFRQDGRGKMDV